MTHTSHPTHLSDLERKELKKQLEIVASHLDPFSPAEKIPHDVLEKLKQWNLDHLLPDAPYELTKQILKKLHDLETPKDFFQQ